MCAASDHALAALVLPQPEGERDVETAEEDRKPGNHPDYRQSTGAWLHHQNDAEGNRQDSVEDEQPFVLQHAAQRDGAPDLGCTDDDGPGGDKHQQHDRGHSGVPERHHAGEDAGDAAEAQPPTRAGVAAGGVEGSPYRNHTVAQRVGAPQPGQCDQRQAGPNDRQNAKGDGGQ
ncbi:hypothetical protein chiPu_0029778, partial [Chiloscyllium punctatum]|nr:hypothetical protein [Chiloscyllium punctatum]